MKRTVSRASRAAVAVLIASLFLIPMAGRAQVPQTINYQGALSDAAGAPVSGTYDISFTLYDAAAGGSVLWGDTLSVAVANGAFIAVFGTDVGNPLDPSVFENPVYLGIQVLAGPGVPVGGDPEMTPRQAMTAVGYAMRAKTVETDSLNALACAPDEVAKWSGSAWGCAPDTDTDTTYVAGAGLTLSATTFAVDSLGITGAMIAPGAVSEAKLAFDPATQAELDGHAGAAAAHHGRYTDAEAQAAVGPHVTSVGGLTGGTITGSVTVTSTMSAGRIAVSDTNLVSNLNADRLDDLQAAEIVAAAQDEVRVPITALPFAISAPGSYYLTGDLSTVLTTDHGITVDADNVTIDLMGYSVVGPGSGINTGIRINGRSNVEVRNGTVRGFQIGIFETTFAAGSGHRVINVRAVSNSNRGIYLEGQGHVVKDSKAANNGSHGIESGDAAIVTGNTVYGNVGYGILGGARNTVTGNTVYDNGSNGIRVGVGSTVSGNTSADNGAAGFLILPASTVTGNTAYQNATQGISASSGVTLRGNTAYFNGNEGILLSGNDFVDGNTAVFNDQLGVGSANISTCASCTVVNNHAP